jgi:predicted  nucleic acid-binding Zn-ribbon protein
MSALQKLHDKIQQWKQEHEELKRANENLKSQLADVAAAQKENESLKIELEGSNNRCKSLEEEIAALRRELEEKDAEIEKIVTQVEALLS